MNPDSSPVRDIATAPTGFVRVSFPAIWAGHTQARFVLYYNTDPTRNNVPPGLITSSWHYVSAVVKTINESTFSASIYVNGTLIAGPVYSFLKDSSGLAFAGQTGIALGRNYPMSAPFGYFMGLVDELIVMDQSISGTDVMSIMKISCFNVPQTVLCFSFDRSTLSKNGSILDIGSGLPSHAVAVSQDKFLPWCITRNDGGNLLLDISSNLHPYGLSWGFCTSKARLPGAGFEYDSNTLDALKGTFEEVTNEFHLKNLSGCSNIPLIIDGNTAGR
jgi:hypothetical protein